MVKISEYGKTPEGQVIKAFTLTTPQAEAVIIERGATLTSFRVPDSKGEMGDIVLGFDTLEEYLTNPPFFGATVGRSANRIAGASFELDGVKYEVEANDGPNNLHTHMKRGFPFRNWTGQADEEANAVTFYLEEEDGYTLFPGNLKMEVTYALTGSDLRITFKGSSDKKTIINCTNHAYFNLAGHDHGNVGDHFVQIFSSRYVPVGAGVIPTGELAEVEGTPFDLREGAFMRDRMDVDHPQLKLAGGFDHTYCRGDMDPETGLWKAATALHEGSGRTLTLYTDLPGFQYYTANFLGECRGKEGAQYGRRYGLCFEGHYFPDSIHHSSFEQPVFGPGKDYHATIVYSAGVAKEK